MTVCQHNNCMVDEPHKLATYELLASTSEGRDNFTAEYCHRHDPRDGELGNMWKLVDGESDE